MVSPTFNGKSQTLPSFPQFPNTAGDWGSSYIFIYREVLCLLSHMPYAGNRHIKCLLTMEAKLERSYSLSMPISPIINISNVPRKPVGKNGRMNKESQNEKNGVTPVHDFSSSSWSSWSPICFLFFPIQPQPLHLHPCPSWDSFSEIPLLTFKKL